MNKTRNNAGLKTREQDEENIMEIILSKQCEALTGSLGHGFGYYIRRVPRKDGSVRFFSQRSKWNVPTDGHLRFIFTCAELAHAKLHITDVQLSRDELKQALWEAKHFIAAQNLKLKTYNAQDIINLKHTFGL
jgi:hypothetical protein